MTSPEDSEDGVDSVDEGEVDDFSLQEFESDGSESAEDPDESGLELGDAQADEIRQIFMTTLPQYIEPLEELMEQALAQPDPEASIINTLTTTVTSILAAAQRIGVEDIADSLVEMNVLIKELAVSEPAELQDELRGVLHKIKVQSGSAGAPGDGAGAESQTLVAALGAVEGFDMSILESLTAAGLVTVSQLEMARKHEIVAVTGLPTEAVDALLDALGIEERVRTRNAALERGRPEPEEDGELLRHLREQVEAEDALGQARAEVQHARSRIAILRDQLDRSAAMGTNHGAREAEARERMANARRARSRAHHALQDLEAKRSDLEGGVLATRERISAIASQHRDVEREQEELRAHLAELGEQVQRLLATADELP